METLADLFEEQIKDLYSAEQQLMRALPKLTKKVSSPELKDAMQQHLAETEEHVRRLQQIAEAAGFKPNGKMCAGMKGLLEEGTEAAGEEGEDAVIDGAIIAAAQRVEHYEVSGYGTAKALAKLLGHDELAELLDQTLEEEVATDEKLTEIAEQSVYPNARVSEEDEEEETEDEEVEAAGSTGSRGKSSGGRGRGRSKR